MWPSFTKIATSILSVGAQPDFALAALSNNISSVRTRIEMGSRQYKFCLGETHYSVIARTGNFYRFSRKTPTFCCRDTDRIWRKKNDGRPPGRVAANKIAFFSISNVRNWPGTRVLTSYSYTHLKLKQHSNRNSNLDTACSMQLASRVSYRWIFDYTLITNLMHWLLFIHKILFSSTCFEHQVLIFRRI